jgi:uncharacterized SAM-binding protein YcdF (DUF218 family)
METIEEITKYIFIEDKPEKADLIFVFGARSNKMAEKAFELYDKKFAPKILVSGGENRFTKENEAHRIFADLVGLGVKTEDIILEDKAINTLENVLFSKPIIEEKIGFKNIKKIILVSKNFHCRRAKMTMKKHFPKGIKYFAVPYDAYDFTKEDWFKNETSKQKVLEEFDHIKEYLQKGDIEEL